MASAEQVDRGALRRTLALLRPHLKGSRGIAVLGVVAIFAEVVARLLEPWPISWVIDLVGARVLAGDPAAAPAGAAQAGGITGWLASLGTSQLLLVAGLGVVFVAALRAAAAFLSSVAFANVGAQVSARLRVQVHGALLTAPSSFHASARSGDLVTRVVSDVNRIQEAGVTAGLPLLANTVTVLGMLGVVLWLDPVLGFVVVIALPLLGLSGRNSSGKITAASRVQRKREGDLAGDAAEAFGAISTVQAYDLAGRLTDRLRSTDKKGLGQGVKAKRLAAGLERRTDLIVGVATGIVLMVGGHRMVAGAITPGELVVFITYLKTTFKPLRNVAKHVGRISRAAASGERIADTMEEAEPRPEPEWARPLPPANSLLIARGKRGVGSGRPPGSPRGVGRIEVRDLQVGYSPEQPILSGVDLVVPAGQRVALVGPSGAGKSTFLSVLMRLLSPQRGRVLLDGHDLEDITSASVRAATAVVLQDGALWSGTLAENVRLGRADATDDDVEWALREAGLGAFIDADPEGIHRHVGERGRTLSGGQRQRVAVARALVRDPRLVLLDEPSTGLDAASTEALVAGLKRLCDGRTTIVVTHDERLLSLVDRVLEVRDQDIRDITDEIPALVARNA